jgi:short-subunit dehydrogenase
MSEFTWFEKQNAARLEKMTMINLVVPMLLCQSLLPMLKGRPDAAIVNIGSTFGSIGHPGFATYCANKFGLRGFTEALRRELSDLPLRILYLAPRATRTDMNSAAVDGLNEELGNAVDDPQVVVKSLLSLLKSGATKPHFIGWPERLFVRLNGLAPGIIDRAMRSRLPVIRRYAG